MNSKQLGTLLASILVFSLALAGTAHAQPAAIVKVPTPTKIDGAATEWAAIKASQTIDGRLGPVGSFKLAYDDANLYALVNVTDVSPLKNNISIVQELLKGGDAISLCFGPLDGKLIYNRIVLAKVGDKNEVIAMRPHWSDQAHKYTYSTMAGGTVPMDFVGRLDKEGAQVAFALVAGGYSAEAKIPWSSIGLKPTPNLKFSFDVQIIFSDPGGTTNVDTAWWHSTGGGPYSTTDVATEARLYPEAWGVAQLFETDPGPSEQRATQAADPVFTPGGVPISFTLPRASKVSVIVRDKNGWIVRELLRARDMKAGKQTIYWDGRDRWGALQPPGEYSFRVGYFDGLKTRFAGSAGNSAFPPYRTEDGLGSIGGMHAGPQAVAPGGGMTMYLLNGGEEGQRSLRKIDINTGKSLWFHSVGGFGMGQSMASDEKFAYMIYAANSVTSLVRMDSKTGANTPIGSHREPIKLGNIETQGLVIAGGKVFYSVPKENRIGTIDLASGEKGADIKVEAVRGICKSSEDLLLVCKGTEVVRLNLQSLEQKTLVSDLQEPSAVATDGAGNIYVSDLGKSQQIKKYTNDGRFVSAFGVPGGRGLTAVPYNPMAFRGVKGLAVGPDGNLWAVEPLEPPRRFTRISLDGKWVQDIYGPTRCGDIVGFDLDDVSSVWFSANPSTQGQFINAKVDYGAYAKSPDGSKGFKVQAIWRMNQTGTNENVTPDLMLGKFGVTAGGYNRCAVFTATNGKRYFWITGSGERTGLWLWEENKWKPVATVGGRTTPYWSDKNGDGLVQPEETSDLPVQGHWNWMGRDLTLYSVNGSLKPASINTRGVPTYAGGKFTPYLLEKSPSLWNDYFDVQAYSAQMTPGTSDNSVYFTGNNGPHQNRDFWDRASENRIVKIKDGRVQWMVGNHDGTLAHNGDQIISFGIAGEVDGVVLVSDVAMNFVGYTTDGLALGWALTDENGRPPAVGPNAIYVENAAPGVFIKDHKTGKRLLLTHTSEDERILEVSGVFGDDITRIDGKLTLVAPLPRASQAISRVTSIPYSTWQKSIYEGWRPTNVDGYDYEWSPNATSLPISAGKSLVGEIRLRRDAGNLCVFAEVLDPTPFPISTSAGVKDAGTLFGRGDGVELLLGSGTGDAKRTAAGPGDTRLFFTATRDEDGKLVGHVFACKPASQPVPPSTELSVLTASRTYRDGGTKAPLNLSDGLKPVPGAIIRVRERFDRQGYTFEAELPIALMPELSRQQSVAYCYASSNGAGLVARSTRSDLLPVRLNAAIWRGGAIPQRLAWQADGFTGTDPKQMNPSAWGLAGDPLPVLLSVASTQAQPPALRYETTRASSFTFGTGPTVKVDSAIFGGGWFNENGLRFLTTSPREGFSMQAGDGAGEAVQGNWRTSKLDMSAIGISNLDSRSQRSFGLNKPTTATVKVDFPAGQSGKLHVLWGGYTDNSAAGGELKIVDIATGESLDSTKQPELSFKTGINSNFEARETIVTVAGATTLNIEVADNQNAQRAYLQGLWIEPNVQTSFAVGATVSLAAYTGSTLAPIRSVEFYADSEKIGEARQAPFVIQWRPIKAGSYRVTARATDEVGSAGTSEATTVKITPASKNK
jgi:hypothetical protein